MICCSSTKIIWISPISIAAKFRCAVSTCCPPSCDGYWFLGVRWAEKAVDELGISADIIDLRSLVPLDYESITASVKRTNKVLILHEDTLFGGIGGEIAAWISEHLFEFLDAPVLRAASLDTPVPFAIPLEQNFFPIEQLKTQLNKLLNY